MASSTRNNKGKGITSVKKAVKKTDKSPVSEKTVFHSAPHHTQFLLKAGKQASEQALREAKALGLEIMYIEDGIMYREKDGKSEVVKVVAESQTEKYKKIKKGVTLYVKK